MSSVMLEFMDEYGPQTGADAPIRLVTEVFGAVPDEWQEQVLYDYGSFERRISIASCHGVGKTTTAAWAIWTNLLTRFPQNTVATAPTGGQLDDALVKEVMIWYHRLPEALQTLYEVKAREIALKLRPKESFFKARTSRAETPEALQGVHMDPGHVLMIADEASGVAEQVFESAIGNMSQENATTLLLSNPTRTSGFFFDTHHRAKEMWKRYQIGHADSNRVDDDFVAQVAAQYGEDSNAFRVRALGLFPKADDDTVIPYEFVKSAQERDIKMYRDWDEVWGVDVARFGSDKSVFLRRKGRIVLDNIQVWEGLDNMEVAGRVKAAWDELPPHERPSEILIDSIGYGSGVVDRLRELKLPVRGINVGESAAAKEEFADLRSELWFKGRSWFERRDCKMPTNSDPKHPAEQLLTELTLSKYKFMSNGKKKVESKDELKKRGYKSPNIADAFLLSLAGEHVTLKHGSGYGSKDWNTPLTRSHKGIV